MEGCYNIFSSKQWIFLFCSITSYVCGMYCYDIPGSLQNAFISNYNLSDFQYSLLYSLYSLPCIIASILGGYFIDSLFGIKKTTILFALTAVVGTILFVTGGNIYIFWIMGLGRFLFGTGDETVTVCICYYTFIRFKESYVNLIFSLAHNFGYLGTTIVYQVSNRLYLLLQRFYSISPKESLGLVLIIDGCVYIMAFAAMLTIALMKPEIEQVQDGRRVEHQSDKSLSEPSDLTEPHSHPKEEMPEQTQNELVKSVRVNKILDFLKFPPSYWFLCIAYSSICNAVFTFEQFSQQMFTEDYSLTINEASDAMTTLNMTKLALSIPISLLVDRLGRNTTFMVVSVVTAIMAHSFLLLHISPYVCMVVLGISYAITGSSIWPMFVYPLEEAQYGMGYGIATSFSNFTSFIFPIVAGKIIDHYGLFWVQIFYVIVLIWGLVSILLVWLVDKAAGGVLNLTPDQRKAHQHRIMADASI